MEEFEKLLTKEIINSLNNHPEEWQSSIVGIKRKDGLDLALGTFAEYSTVNVYKPYKYEIIDLDSRKIIFKLAKDLLKVQEDENKKKESLGSEKKLADFLNLDTRKNKLDHIKEISSKYDIVENNEPEPVIEPVIEPQKVKRSFLDIFKKHKI